MTQEDLVRSRLSFKSYVSLFPVATWVAQSIELFKAGADFFSILLAYILFTFIPVEVYVSELWGRAASPSAKTRNIFMANVLDLTGVFSLSLFYIAYPSLVKARSSSAEWSKVSLLLLGFGGLLVLNYIWNRLSEVRHRQVFNELRQSIIEEGRKQQEQVARNAFVILAKPTSFLKNINYILFAFLFPFVGCVMVLVGFLLLLFRIDPTSFHVQQNVMAWAIIIVMSLSLLAKLLHTFILSSVIDGFDNANLNISSKMLEVQNEVLSVSGSGNEVVEIVSRLREICVLNDALSIDRLPASGPFKSNRRYTRRAFAQDVWDTTAFHIVNRNSRGEYTGTLRINFSQDGNLPFTEGSRAWQQCPSGVPGCGQAHLPTVAHRRLRSW